MEEPYNLTLFHLREINSRLSKLTNEVSDLRQRLLLLENESAGLSAHRVRHEGKLAEFHVMLDVVERRLEISNG